MNARKFSLWIAICIVTTLFLGGCDIIKATQNAQTDQSSEVQNTIAEANENEVVPEVDKSEEGSPTPLDAVQEIAPAEVHENNIGFELGGAGGSAALSLGSRYRSGGGGMPPSFKLDENEFSYFQPNQFNNVLNSPFSTFGADVDTASYSILRYNVQKLKCRPDNQLLRTEEMLNYFRYDYPEPNDDEPFSITTELVKTPWNNDTQLLLIGMQSPKLKDFPPSNIVFLIDVSGSMNHPEKIILLKDSIIASLDSFTENDRISIVTYASEEQLVLSGANPVKERDKIIEAVNSLVAFGSTNGERGLEMAYTEAAKYFIKGGNNRIIMGTDGDLNVGISSQNELKAYVEKKRGQGIFLSILGFGFDNLKDNRMETLADNGNGSYHYIDTIEEAKRVLVKERESTLYTSAKDVKFQIDFNPSKVKGYRLIGYETRKLNTEDFKNDKKDGGEIGVNQQMTVLYEIVPAGSKIKVAKTHSAYQKTEIIPSDDLATLAVRYKKPDQDTSQEIKFTITSNVNSQMSENIQFAAAVAEVGMLLNESEFKGTSTYESAASLLEPLNSVKTDPYRTEFLEMVQAMPNLPNLPNKPTYYPGGYVKFRNPSVTGSIDKRIIQKVVRQHSGELRACYERELNKNRNLYGKLIATWEITSQGATDKVTIKESELNKDVDDCISNSIKHWRFPAPKGGGTAQVEFPFIFE